MGNPIKTYMEVKRNNAKVRDHLSDIECLLFDVAKESPFPSNLRQATPEDVCVGNIFYYPKENIDDSFWQIIEEVRYPDDDFKAYLAEDGCRYGLNGAFVEDN
jgi:hypothetical protein